MKKLLIWILVLALCTALFGCTENGTDNTQSSIAESQQAVIEETKKATETTVATQVTEASIAVETTEASAATEATESIPVHSDKGQESMVWIPTKGGKKYHSKENCSGMIEPSLVTISEAEQQGFTPCKKCYK